MSALLKFEHSFPEVTTCCVCGIVFTFTTLEMRRNDGKGFNCPNGHSLSFGKGEVVLLREAKAEVERQLLATRCQRDMALAERDRLAKQQKNLKKRIANK